jgi:hypothetical protein
MGVKSSPQAPRARRRPFVGTVLGLCVLLVGTLAAARAQAHTGGAASSAPTAAITSSPASPTTSTTATVAFVTTNASKIKCSLDGASFVSCTSPVTYTGLAVGWHSFVVKATSDTLGAKASAAWQIVAAG